MKAIVLSAGQGRRLLPLTETRPKCLVQLSGRSLLAWQLDGLYEAGVTEAVVVVGFGAEQVEGEIAAIAPRGMRVRSLFNPFYAVADNLGSCWVARDEMASGDFLILNGDTLFEPAVATRLMAAPAAPITLAVDRKPTYDSDDMKVRAAGRQLLAIGKTLPLEIVSAESIGFLRFSPVGGRLFVDAVETAMRRPQGLRQWYLSVIDGLAQATGEVEIQSIEGLEWGEMDFPADFLRNQALTESWLSRAA